LKQMVVLKDPPPKKKQLRTKINTKFNDLSNADENK
jgi:hypothetical protein